MSGFGHLQLSPHFQLREFRCRGTTCGCTGAVKVDETLVALLEAIREHVGQALTVNCGFRCRDHNADVGGFPDSNHMKGTAADVTSAKLRFNIEWLAGEIGEFIRDFAGPGNGNVIYYTARGFIHVDVSATNWTTVVREKVGK